MQLRRVSTDYKHTKDAGLWWCKTNQWAMRLCAICCHAANQCRESLRVQQLCSVRRYATSGQSTVEYALVLSAFLAMLIGMGALHDFLTGATLVQHALESASHHISGVTSGALNDVFVI